MTDRCFLWSHKYIFSQKRNTCKPGSTFPINRWGGRSRADGICQHSDAPPSRKSGGVAETETGDQPCAWHSRVAQHTQATAPSSPGASHPSSQSIHRRPAVILFVQINNENAAAAHGGTQRVVIAELQAGSDGLCGRLALLHCDLVCVCNFPQA